MVLPCICTLGFDFAEPVIDITQSGYTGFGINSPAARIHTVGLDNTSSNYAFKADNINTNPLLYVRNDGKSAFNTNSFSKGNFTFKILKNGAKAEDLDIQDTAVDTKPDPDPDTNLVDVGKRRSNIKASGLKQPEQDVANLGRKRRKTF